MSDVTADGEDRELLIEQAAGAWRPPSLDGRLRAHPAWHDLDERGRRQAHETALRMRLLEAALDSEGLSSTARAVLARIRDPR